MKRELKQKNFIPLQGKIPRSSAPVGQSLDKMTLPL